MFFQIFHLTAFTDHLKHAKAEIKFSHETLIIYDYWKTLAFCNCSVNNCSINEYILKYFFQIFPLILLRASKMLFKHPLAEM